jgi:D-alanyl-D-alanine carboxypeptidase
MEPSPASDRRYPNAAFLEATVQRMAPEPGRARRDPVRRERRREPGVARRGGQPEPDGRYFIASVTKMYVTVVVLRLRQEGRIDLDDPIHRHLPADLIAGLHVLNGVDRTHEITVRHLISNTSGLTDYFFGKGPDGQRSADRLLAGQDEAWPLERIVERVRTLKPRFLPGQPGKVHYSDTNYELLGPDHRDDHRPTDRAGLPRSSSSTSSALRDTYAFTDPTTRRRRRCTTRTRPVHMPRYIASVTAEGGIVSTAAETMTFLKAFFTGRFFPPETSRSSSAGTGSTSPASSTSGSASRSSGSPGSCRRCQPLGELLGFWGQSGAFAFHNPQRDLYFTGTVNQLSGFGHGAAVSAMVRIMKAVR